MKFVNTSHVSVNTFVRVCVVFEGLTVGIKFTVLDCACPTILGMEFLVETNPVVDWVTGSVQFNKRAQVTSCRSDDNVWALLGNETVSDPELGRF